MPLPERREWRFLPDHVPTGLLRRSHTRFHTPPVGEGVESDKANGAAFLQTHQEEMPGAVKMVAEHRSRHIHGQLPQGETDVRVFVEVSGDVGIIHPANH